MVTNATALHPFDRQDPATAWQLVVRTAMAASIVTLALVYALRTFAHFADLPIVAVVAAIGLAVGTRLPAAQPPIPHWLMDDAETAELR
jgi:hypothetical protein